MGILSSSENILIVGRRAVLEFVQEQPQNIRELHWSAGEGSASLNRLLEEARKADLKVVQVPKKQLDDLCGHTAHQGVVIFPTAPAYADLNQVIRSARAAGEQALLVVADHIQDPQNLGALMRSALGAGASALIIPKDRACPLTSAVAKASAGASARLPVARVTNLSNTLRELKEAGLWVLSATNSLAPPPWTLDLRRPLALVVGNEHKGVSPQVIKHSDMLTGLPLQGGLESLNAAVAAGILLFEVIRQRSVHPRIG